ncbi:MAG: Lon protease [Candidatus Woesebacteria bacterium GW2011_GWC1_38_13]|uniref:Lon protease n=3 Tax=Candidatus Woeseibacteriota TaxID=1752722 RepID=A0A0G0KW43_9BACT|nr:MAG: Lon protease [Candidatus Woesebacteria bacterium GW2011_GWD1_38_10]KKQ56305.1 MAG: Lon protease [Candidatus Woesebacteria bacterium GW2011_GWC1_38_13]KKQ83903.1 MAG: Lon protease [Candidatus Woesebacteria bacterium GW2011_GWA1_38_8]
MTQSASEEQLGSLTDKINNSKIPEDLKGTVLIRLDQLKKLVSSSSFLPELDRISRYIEWIISLPWNDRTQDNLDLTHAKNILDKNHHGLDEIKDRILEYISIMKLKQERGESGNMMRAPALCFVGLVGTGKTTIAISIAEALGRTFVRIPFGGMENPFDLRGQSKVQPEAEPGKIVKAVRAAKAKNPVILLDEVDRVTDTGRASIMGVLVELLDPEQNHAYTDHYIDYPFDLSEVLFVATANNTHHIATAVLDRLEPISMPSYSDREKIAIGRQYMLPKILSDSGISDGVINISDDVWPQIVRPLGFDAGTRTLERTIKGVVRKIAKLIVEGKGQRFDLTPENIREFLPR